jgi:hypothetical protein
MWFMVFYAIVIFAALAMTVREGLWSNMLILINITLSGLVAFAFYMPLVIWLDEMSDGEHTYWLDFAVIWALYAATFVIFRTITTAASKTRMRFKHPIDPIGGPLVGFISAWVLAAFTLATLHLSPMPKEAFSGRLVKSSEVESASGVMAPDAAWLRFVERVSRPAALGVSPPNEFDAKAFVSIYEDRRAQFEKNQTFVVDRR